MTQADHNSNERWVRHRTRGVKGRLVRRSRDRAEVETPVGRLIVDARDLVEETAAAPRRQPAEVVTISRERERIAVTDTLDLHHLRVADVEPLLSQYLDRCAVRGLHRVRIIHGKGEGKLLREVARCLKGNPAIERFHLADPIEGSYGVTVAYLNGTLSK